MSSSLSPNKLETWCFLLLLILVNHVHSVPSLKAQALPAPNSPKTTQKTTQENAQALQVNLFDLTLSQLLERANQAHREQNWPHLEHYLNHLFQEYQSEPQASDALRLNRPYLALARLRQHHFDENTLLLIEDSLQDAKIEHILKDELAYWRGLVMMSLENFQDAQKSFDLYAKTPQYNLIRRRESILLQGMCLIMNGDFKGAVEFYPKWLPEMKGGDTEAWGRGQVMWIYALMQDAQYDQALSAIIETHAAINLLTPLISYQSLTLELGNHFLEEDRPYDALRCFQRVFLKEKTLQLQEAKLNALQDQIKKLAPFPERQSEVFAIQQTAQRIQREIDQFKSVESFDASLRLRQSNAYQNLQRPLECALLLQEIVVNMEPDALSEQASRALTYAWTQSKRWQQAIASADLYLKQFYHAENPKLPEILFLRGISLRELQKLETAEAAFGRIADAFPQHPLAAQSLFLVGICQLEQELYQDAFAVFEKVRKRWPQTPFEEESDYWQGMALSFQLAHEEARQHHLLYLNSKGEGARYLQEARFRVAFSSHALAEYERGNAELAAFISSYPGTILAEEAKLLLGDGYGAVGEIERALEAYRSLDPDLNFKYFEEGVFKIGNALKLSRQYEAMRAHFEAFLTEYPHSHRLAEAVYWVGWSWEKDNQPAKASEIYWKTFEQLGNDARILGMEDLLMGLSKVANKDEDHTSLIRKFHDLEKEAESKGHPLKALRAAWARAKILESTRPDFAQSILIGLHPSIDPKNHPVTLTLDVADALNHAGHPRLAKTFYRELRRWNPKSAPLDRIHFGLGQLAEQESAWTDAVREFRDAERLTFHPSLLNEARLHLARLYHREKHVNEASSILEKLLSDAEASSRHKAEALMLLGDYQSERGDLKRATAYWERIYLVYRRHSDLVGEAYWKRAQALETLKQNDGAFALYEEFLEWPGSASHARHEDVKKRYNSLKPLNPSSP